MYRLTAVTVTAAWSAATALQFTVVFAVAATAAFTTP